MNAPSISASVIGDVAAEESKEATASLDETASDAESKEFWAEFEEQIDELRALDKNAKSRPRQFELLAEMGWASELADLAQLALKLKKSSGITRKQLQQQRLGKFTAFKAALDSGRRKEAQQELRNTTSKTLEVACDIQADVKELKGTLHSLAHTTSHYTPRR